MSMFYSFLPCNLLTTKIKDVNLQDKSIGDEKVNALAGSHSNVNRLKLLVR